MNDLPEGEAKILGLVCWGVLRAVAEDYRYEEIAITLVSGGHTFTFTVKTVLTLGWMAYEKKERSVRIPDFSEGQDLVITDLAVKEGKTSPPAHYKKIPG